MFKSVPGANLILIIRFVLDLAVPFLLEERRVLNADLIMTIVVAILTLPSTGCGVVPGRRKSFSHSVEGEESFCPCTHK